MEIGERIGSMARVVRYDARARETVRRRILATVAMTLFLVGLLAALGLSILVPFALFAAALVGIGGALTARFGHSAAPVRQATSQTAPPVRSGRDMVARLSRNVLAAARFQGPRHVAIVASAVRRVGTACETAAERACRVVVAQAARLRAEVESRQTPSDPDLRGREAFQLNAQGSQFRREGLYARSVERHRAALTILRELGDRRAEALTLNNLALAVVHTDGIEAAVEHFEQALTVLRALGDEEHEGRVIANLGFIHRSHGSSEEADGLLHAALDKLPTDSRAYRKVEEQLRRAS